MVFDPLKVVPVISPGVEKAFTYTAPGILLKDVPAIAPETVFAEEEAEGKMRQQCLNHEDDREQ